MHAVSDHQRADLPGISLQERRIIRSYVGIESLRADFHSRIVWRHAAYVGDTRYPGISERAAPTIFPCDY